MTDETTDPVVEDLRYLRELDDATLLGHVQAQHLIAFAEGRIDDPASSFVRDHVGGCEVCREAMEVYRATVPEGDAAGDGRDARPGSGLWDLLRRTVLAPAPALAYLVVLAVGLGLWSTAPGPTVDAPDADPVLVALYADDTLRGGEVEVEPVPVAWTAGRPLILLLHTDILPGDVDGPLTVRVELNGSYVVDHHVPQPELRDDGVVSVAVPPAKVHEGAVYRVIAEGKGALPFTASFRVGVKSTLDGDRPT